MDLHLEAGHTAADPGGLWRKTMSTIHITFDDLCAFFTSKLNAHLLMVGMIQNQASDPNDIHEPIIKIYKQGQLEKTYRGFDKVEGKVFLYVYKADDDPAEPSIRDNARLEGRPVPFNN